MIVVASLPHEKPAMYLVTFPIPTSDAAQLIFCMTDPRSAGYSGPVQTDTELEAPTLCDSSWRTAGSNRVVGQHRDDPRRYRLFESAAECRAEGFRLVGPMPVVAFRWTDELARVAQRG